MGLLWEFEDLMRILLGICKDFPGIHWEISGIYSLTRVFFMGIMLVSLGTTQIRNASNKDSPKAAL